MDLRCISHTLREVKMGRIHLRARDQEGGVRTRPPESCRNPRLGTVQRDLRCVREARASYVRALGIFITQLGTITEARRMCGGASLNSAGQTTERRPRCLIRFRPRSSALPHSARLAAPSGAASDHLPATALRLATCSSVHIGRRSQH